MRRLAALAGVLLATAGTVAPARAADWSAYDRPATNGVVVERNVAIAMPDGTVLRANVERPDRPGSYPVLLMQTPYGKDGPTEIAYGHSTYLVRRGYIQVIVDVRGTGSSEGSWDAFGGAEQRDGYDLVEWAARQPWSDGDVGLVGGSYMGTNQLFTAALRPPHLRAIFPVVPIGDAYRDVVQSGGSFNGSFMPLWFGLVTAGNVTRPPAGNPASALRILASHVAGTVDVPLHSLSDAATGGDLAFDGPFWRQRSPLEVADAVDVPAFVVAGLHDLFQRGTPLLYERLRRHHFARLLIGPWNHVEATHGAGLPRDGVPSLDQIQLRWFDHWLKGIDTNVGRIPSVTTYAYGVEHYETTADWPDPRLRVARIYLRGGGRLADEPPRATEPAQSYLQRPLSGLCSLSTTQWTAGIAGNLSCDDGAVENALGHASYDTAPLARDLRIAGPILADVWIATAARDAPVTVRVVDVAPNGAATELTDGWLAAGFRDVDATRSRMIGGMLLQPWHPFTRASWQPVTPGKPTELAVEVFPTSAVIKAGHRLRLVIAPADFPHQTPSLPQLRDSLAGRVRVLTDPQHLSSLAFGSLGGSCRVRARRSRACGATAPPPLTRG